MKDSFKIERPIPKYADTRRTSAPAVLWSAANLIDEKPTTSTVDSIKLMQRLLETERTMTSQMDNDTASPDSGIGIDQTLEAAESHKFTSFGCDGFTSSTNRNFVQTTDIHDMSLSAFLWPWLNVNFDKPIGFANAVEFACHLSSINLSFLTFGLASH
ncbi:hypothetical protein DICVIV_09788 [Dictyocaulus viviparus]|uniref:Uncharacterized protein n=1 Tax=Dictyocaulus viviparus TaxID=29172 RepID=A0A0D8XKA7_DICVI|nr:hypothetical protein DICVIV_09788 [Dictyocaulus viviparus]